ncbi:MAG TPA: trypsin-like peptidase domain-containing protein [Verrucomicrobiae bacterium]
MKRLPVFFFILLFLPALAAEKMTSVTIDGTSYTGIQDAHLVSGGRVVILYESGGTTVTPDKLPKAFLDSWGIKMDQVEKSKEAAQRQAAQSLDEAILAGYFREVEGIVYDMRKPQAGWTHFVGAKIIKVAGDGALIEPNPGSGTNIFVRNLPHGMTDGDPIDVMARVSGSFTYVVSTQRGDFEHTIRAYDVGRVCMRSEIPDAILKQGAAAAALPNAPKPRSFEVTSLPDSGRLRAIGSGFFVTRDGYLLTNFHVVKEASTVKVKYGSRIFKASVIETDEDNDLALIKVDGEVFPALAISGKDSADLGEDVFTIGFPNIEMQGLQPKYTDGRISSLSGMQDNPKEYQISVPVQPGNSGGPLCDSNGEVVGIIVARLNDMAVMQLQGVVPQNVNYAIKARIARQMLQGAKGVTPIAPHGKKPADLIKSVENAIAMILIY